MKNKIDCLEENVQQITMEYKALKSELEKQNGFTIKQFEEFRKQDANLNWRLNNTNKEISYRYLKGLHPDQYREALEEWYYQHTLTHLNLDSPKSFNEKIQWLKLYDSTPEKTRLADKFLVRDWVKARIGEQYLVPLLGVWDRFDDIDFDSLPNKFVLKTNHGSSWNVIVNDKESLDMEATRYKFNSWMKKNFAFCNGLELHYKNIVPKIIAEEFLESDKDLNDYRFFCFNGVIELIWVDMFQHENRIRNIYDKEWTLLPVIKQYPNNPEIDVRPTNYEKMMQLAQELSKGFIFVRVDFYEVKGKIYFGEMTFTSCSGYGDFLPETFNYELGEKLKLPIE